MKNLILRYVLITFSLSMVIACARLPDYAKPRTIPIDEINGSNSNSFTYRPLTPGDFRAASLPEKLSLHGEKINAQSVIQIRLTADSNFRITRWSFSGQPFYTGSLNQLAFEAVMMPDSSWWNPKIKAALTDYVLQHEQIHFALTEIAARKLTRDARKWVSDFSVKKETPQEVYSEIVQQIKSMIKSAMEANQKRHQEFDEDTSLSYAPAWQAWWSRKVEEELKKTETER